MSNYFSKLPNLLYLDRGNKEIRTYARAKNLFRRIKIREINDDQITNFELYNVLDGERPDNVAEKFYNDPNLDWVVLLANNILNVQSEWPLDNRSMEKYLDEKYGDDLFKIAHYESLEVANSTGEVIFPKGIIVPENYSFTYFDVGTNQYQTVVEMTYGVTNNQVEQRRQNKLRAIRILKPEYVDLVEQELEEMMKYKEGTSQYQGKYLKMVDDIRINL